MSRVSRLVVVPCGLIELTKIGKQLEHRQHILLWCIHPIHGGGGGDGGDEKVEAQSQSLWGKEMYVGQVHSVEQVCLVGCCCLGHHHSKGVEINNR